MISRPVQYVKRRLKALVPEAHRTRADMLYSLLVSPLYAGNRYYCPVCRGRFRTFLPHWNEIQGLRCPRCRAQERHRLLALYLRRAKWLRRRRVRLLHVAPEPLIQRWLRAQPAIAYYSGDLVSSYADLHFDLCDMPFREGFFDVVICNHVLEHIPDDRAAMAEIFRVLRPGGRAILMVPLSGRPQTYENWAITAPQDRIVHFGQHDHVRWYGWDYRQRLQEAGFRVQFDDFARCLSPRDRQRMVIDPQEVIPVARKPAPSEPGA